MVDWKPKHAYSQWLCRCLSAVCISSVAFSLSTAGEFPQQRDVESIKHIVDAGFRGDYAVAESLCINLENRHPYHPIGYVMHAAMLQSQMLDDEHFDYADDFYALIRLSERKCNGKLRDSPDDAWVLYCLGLAYGSRAVYDSRAGSWWSAVTNGIKSKRAFTDCIGADSSFYDAYVGIGSYHYWRTVKTGAINWLPFVQDDRAEGLRELRLAADSSLFSADFARNSLIWIWMDMELYEEAESLSVEMQNKYPEGRKFLWSMAYARLKQDDFLGAEAVYTELISRIEANPHGNNYNIVECRYRLASIYLETEQYTKCGRQCRLAQELDLEEGVRKRLKGRLAEIRGMQRQVKRALKRDNQEI
jgi:hypothetical protein